MWATDFLSFVFNLFVYVGFILLAATFLLLRVKFRADGVYNKRKFIFYFGILGTASVLTMWCYVYAPKRIFSNADHHVLEHLGFSFGKTLPLVDEDNPQTALWDGQEGKLKLTQTGNEGFVLRGQNYFSPIFKEIEKGVFEMSNPIIEQPIQQQLTMQWDSVAIALHFSTHKDSLAWFMTTYLGQQHGPFKVPLVMPLKNGYSLAEFISKAQADAPGMAQIIEATQGAFLVRKFYEVGKPTPERSIMLLFPSRELLAAAPIVAIDGQSVALTTTYQTEVPLRSQQIFYTGLWTTQNNIYRVVSKPSSAELLVSFPDKKYLKKLADDKESLFFTSSSNEVAQSEQLAGFYFPWFEQKDNLNHFSANLSYRTGPTRERMKFRVINYDQDDLSTENIRTFEAGDTLLIQSRGMVAGRNQTQWLFRVQDLKTNNPLQFWHLVLLLGLVVAFIYLIIYLTPQEAQTKSEYVVYLLLLVLLTVRLIILWRASTFLPVEDISQKEYNYLRDLGWVSYKLTFGFVVAFFVLIGLWKWQGAKIMRRALLNTKPTFTSFSPLLLGWFMLYVLAFGVLLIGGKMERFGAVLLPVGIYFFLEFLFLQVLQRSGSNSSAQPDYTLLTRLNWLLCFGYLGIADAGFSIVFLVSTLIYWFIRQVTFPLAKPLTLSQLLIRGAMPAIVLLLFLMFAPRLLSLVFRQTEYLVLLVGLMAVVVGGWFLLKKRQFQPFGRVLPVWLVPVVLISGAAVLGVLRGKVVEKVQDKGYVQYRAEVLFNKPDEILQKEQFRYSLKRDSKLLRAAQNQWIINHFYQKRDASLIDYFRVLPSFRQGSSYLTQISDLVTVRYVIGEHNQFVITFLIGLMILLILAATDADTRFNRYSIMRVKVLCLLLGLGLFTWMAATNRMIFLGQDFPLLSMNSFLTLLMTFGILFFVIIWGERANQQPNSVLFQAEGKPLAHRTLNIVMLTAIFIIPLLFNEDLSEEQFSLDDTISRLNTEFEHLNTAFVEFQQTDEQQRLRGKVKLGEVVKAFDQSPFSPRQNKSLFKDTVLALGTYKAYINLLTQNNNGEHLVHVRRDANDLYEFAVNKLFFNVSSPDANRNAWQGNLIAQEKNESFHFTDRESGEKRDLDTKRSDANLKETLASLTNSTQNNNIKLTSLPAGWGADSLPIVILNKTFGDQQVNRSTFVVKNGQDLFRSNASDYALVVKPNDVIQFKTGKNEQRVATLQYQHQSQEYLAKNVWLNGHQQFFYPLGHKFLWPYHFANLVKSKFDKYAKDAPEKHQSIALTLDPRLTEQVYDIAERLYRKGKRDSKTEDARAFNLVVLGSDGGIRALCDYKKGNKLKIDPNRMNSYRELFNNLYLNTDREQERVLFGNRSLMRMDNGPASTFKPILYGAITSQYNLGWQNLQFGGVENVLQPGFLEKNNKDRLIRRFGGGRVKFTVGADNLVHHDMDYYISRSTNTYNSMMAFLGSMNTAEIQREQAYMRGVGSSQYLVRGRSNTTSLNFPLFEFGGQLFRIGRLPSESLYQNPESLLGKGLWYNFNLPVTTEQLKGREAANIQNLAYDLDSTDFADSRSSNKLWSFPEASHLYMIDRNNLHNAIVQVASGADPINTTPYKMAEMAASLFSFNKRFKGSVLDKHHYTYQPFDTHESWGGADNVTDFHAHNLFRAMHHTVHANGATGFVLLNKVANEFADYHFYAKTGTISGKRSGGKRDKNLMIVISHEPLHERNLTVEDLKANRFMVLYFSFYKQSDAAEWGEVAEPLRNMVRAVVQSNSFKKFMNQDR